MGRQRPARERGFSGPRAITTLLVAGAVVALAAWSTSDPDYRSETVIVVTDVLATASDAPPDASNLAERTAAIAESGEVIEEVAATVPIGLTPERVLDATDVSVSDLEVRVGAEAESAEAAATLADRLAEQAATIARRRQRQAIDEAIERLQERVVDVDDEERLALEGTLARLEVARAAGAGVEVSRRASLPGSPEGGAPAAIALGAAVGALAGLVLVALRIGARLPALARRRRTRPEPAARRRRPPGELGLADPSELAVRVLERGSSADEELLRALLAIPGDGGARSLAVVGAERGPDAVELSIAIGAAAVASGRDALVVESPTARPELAPRHGLRASPGIGDYLVSKASPAEVLQGLPVGTALERGDGFLACITAGGATVGAEEVAAHPFASFLGTVTRAYDLVLLAGGSGPAALPPSVAAAADAVVVCARDPDSTDVARLLGQARAAGVASQILRIGSASSGAAQDPSAVGA